MAIGVLAGCSLPPPPGASPLRYRDPIFSNVTTSYGLAYGSAVDASGNPETLTLDMYKPAGDTQTSRPAIVLIHGGSFINGTSMNAPEVTLANAFAQRGYVAVSINYRLLGSSKCAGLDPPPPNCVTAALAAQHDAQAAVRWLRANASTYGIDPTRVAVEGTSAGATTALLVGVDASDPGSSGNPGYSSAVGAAISISGELPHSEAAIYNSSDAPVMMFNGTADPIVPFQAGAQTAADLYNAGVPTIFEPLSGAGHVPFNTFGTLMIDQSVYFAYDFLHLDSAAGQPPAAAKAFNREMAKMAHQHPAVAKQLQSAARRWQNARRRR